MTQGSRLAGLAVSSRHAAEEGRPFYITQADSYQGRIPSFELQQIFYHV